MQRKTADEVVHEIPVYLSKAFEDQLYMMQYPLMPLTVSLENWQIKEVKIKPDQDRIRVTTEVDTSVRYNKNKEAVRKSQHDDDDVEQDEIPWQRERIMETCGVPNGSKSPRYVIGVIQEGKLHVCPLKSIVQMRDIWPHLKNVDEQPPVNSDDEAGNQTDGEAPPATKVYVKFSQSREPGTKSKYPRSFSYSRRQQDDELWIQLAHRHDPKQLERIYSSATESETPFYCLSRHDYLDLAFPKITEVNPEGVKKKPTLQRIPFLEMKNLSIQDQLRHIMFSANVLRYSDLVEVLKYRLGVTIDDVSLLRQIQSIAVLVQGCWAVKSDLLYPATFVSNAHGITGPDMQRGRDIILSQFNEKRLLQRRELCSATNLPVEEVTEILSGLATVVPRKGWEFVKPFDTDFVATCRDVVQRQNLMWEMKNANRERSPPDFKIPATVPTSSGSSPRRKARSVSFSSDTDSGTDSDKGRVKGKRSHKKK